MDEGNQGSARIYSVPYQKHLYLSLARKPAMPASARARAKRWFPIMLARFRVSTVTRPADLAIAVVAL